jgi:hypothetical protein
MADLRQSLIDAPIGSVFVTDNIPAALAMLKEIARKDLTLCGPLLLSEKALAQLPRRQVAVDSGLPMDDKTRALVREHNRGVDGKSS